LIRRDDQFCFFLVKTFFEAARKIERGGSAKSSVVSEK